MPNSLLSKSRSFLSTASYKSGRFKRDIAVRRVDQILLDIAVFERRPCGPRPAF